MYSVSSPICSKTFELISSDLLPWSSKPSTTFGYQHQAPAATAWLRAARRTAEGAFRAQTFRRRAPPAVPSSSHRIDPFGN